jgi:hypothetical protein
MTATLMPFASWITKVTVTHSEYAILIAFLWQGYLRERTSFIRSTYVAFRVRAHCHYHSTNARAHCHYHSTNVRAHCHYHSTNVRTSRPPFQNTQKNFVLAQAALGTKYETRHTSLFHKKIGFTQSLLSSSNNNIFNKGFSNSSDSSSILMHSRRSPIKN